MESDEENTKEKRKHIVIKNSTDLQRMKLEKLMKNPDKLVVIPERPKPRGIPTVPDFVRNVMGSSAGAGSGEFHVYRHLRRKEYARQKYMQEKGERERLDEEYHKKLEDHRIMAEAKTAKKRAKRLKRKDKNKGQKKIRLEKNSSESENQSASEEECTENENEGKITINETRNNDEEIEDVENKMNSVIEDSKQLSLEGQNSQKEKDDHELKKSKNDCEDESVPKESVA